MRWIAHRGNVHGPSYEENNPLYLKEAMDMGYDVEVDLHYIDGTWLLGHDTPDYEIGLDFLCNRRVWTHCKDVQTLEALSKTACALYGVCHYFFHQQDDVTITSQGWIWAFPDIKISGPKTVACLPERHDTDISGFKAVCTDYVSRYVKQTREFEREIKQQ